VPSRKPVRQTDKRLSQNRVRTQPKSRMQQLIDGDITIDDLDDDEIMAGRCKDSRGKFTGRPRAMLPRELHDAMRREFHKRIEEKYQDGMDLALATLQDVMNNRMAAAPARVRAAEVWIERVQGKVPDKIDSTVTIRKFEDNITGLLVEVDEDNVYDISSAHKSKEITA
jgi:hypothetical protein